MGLDWSFHNSVKTESSEVRVPWPVPPLQTPLLHSMRESGVCVLLLDNEGGRGMIIVKQMICHY
jgi:hypothetical protein